MKLRPLILGLLISLLLTACASERVKAENKKAKENKADYVDYYPVGSNIAVKVPKDQAKADEEETDTTQRSFRDRQQRGIRAPSDPEVTPAAGTPLVR